MLFLATFLREVAEPFVLNIYAIPKVMLFPIFLFIFGLGMESKIAFGFFHGIFPIIILTKGKSEVSEKIASFVALKLPSPFPLPKSEERQE